MKYDFMYFGGRETWSLWFVLALVPTVEKFSNWDGPRWGADAAANVVGLMMGLVAATHGIMKLIDTRSSAIEERLKRIEARLDKVKPDA